MRLARMIALSTSMLLSAGARADPLGEPMVWDVEPSTPKPVVPAWKEHPASVEGHVGLGTPVGLIGVTGEYSPLPELGLGIGVGTNVVGPQVALLTRLRPLYGTRNALVVSGSFATGRYQWSDLDFGMGHSGTVKDHEVDQAYWVQVDAGWERRAASGLVVRLAAGLAWLLNPDDFSCTEVDLDGYTSDCGGPMDTIATATVSVGWAF